jgi:hypothetical protein
MLAIRTLSQFAETIAPYEPDLSSYYNTTAQGFIDQLLQNPLWFVQSSPHNGIPCNTIFIATPMSILILNEYK